MSEDGVHSAAELLQAALAVLADHPEGLPAREAIQAVAERLPPTPLEEAAYTRRPHIRRFDKNVRFATISSVKAGWLVKAQGQWSITPAGSVALHEFPGAEALYRECRPLYSAWRRSRPDPAVEEDETAADEPTGSDTALTVEVMEDTAWAELAAYLTTMGPYDFQHLVAALLRAMGYHVAWEAPPGPDGGIDIVAYADPLGARGPRIVVQVRHRQEKAARDALRALSAILNDGDVGLFVSSGGFTSDAEREARDQSRRRLVLLNLRQLVDLWIAHYNQVADSDRGLLPLKAVYYLAPS